MPSYERACLVLVAFFMKIMTDVMSIFVVRILGAVEGFRQRSTFKYAAGLSGVPAGVTKAVCGGSAKFFTYRIAAAS